MWCASILNGMSSSGEFDMEQNIRILHRYILTGWNFCLAICKVNVDFLSLKVHVFQFTFLWLSQKNRAKNNVP